MKEIEGELVPKYQELVQQITNGRVSLVDSNGELKIYCEADLIQ